MSFRLPLTRRQFFAYLTSTALSASTARRVLGDPRDQGIGGTGAVPAETSDRGIGGTGVIGTIRKFGSIIVNDMRISYAPDADIHIDGQTASAQDLKIGQIVRVAAYGEVGSLSTRAIDVTSEVVGPVEKVGAHQIVVLGQSVVTAALKHRDIRLGETVAVSGLRRNDGTIVASLIEARPGASSRIAGPLHLDADGAIRIGSLALSGVDGSLIGRRVILSGSQHGDRFAVEHAITEAALLPSDIHTLSIESYVEQSGDALVLGSGFNVSGVGSAAFPAGRSVRAVLSTSLTPDGGLALDSVRANGHSFETRGAGGRTGLGGGGTVPNGSGIPAGSRSGRPLDFGPRGQEPGNGGGGGGFPGGGSSSGGGLPGGGFPGGGGPGGGFPGGGPPGGGLPGGFGGGGPMGGGGFGGRH